MTDHELAALVLCGQDDHQGREHPRYLLGVAVFAKEAARLVDQHLVEAGRGSSLHSQRGRRPAHHGVDQGLPPRVAGIDGRGGDLAAPSHRGVHERVAAAAIRGRSRHAGQGFDLHGRKGQAQDPHAVDGQAHDGQGHLAGAVEVAGPLDVGQESREQCGDIAIGAHEPLRLGRPEGHAPHCPRQG